MLRPHNPHRAHSIHLGSAADLRDPPSDGQTARPESLRRRSAAIARHLFTGKSVAAGVWRHSARLPPDGQNSQISRRPLRRNWSGYRALLDIHCYYGDTVRHTATPFVGWPVNTAIASHQSSPASMSAICWRESTIDHVGNEYSDMRQLCPLPVWPRRVLESH